jgi:hypothetical protein
MGKASGRLSGLPANNCHWQTLAFPSASKTRNRLSTDLDRDLTGSSL